MSVQLGQGTLIILSPSAGSHSRFHVSSAPSSCNLCLKNLTSSDNVSTAGLFTSRINHFEEQSIRQKQAHPGSVMDLIQEQHVLMSDS